MTNENLDGSNRLFFGRMTCWLVLTLFSCGLPFAKHNHDNHEAFLTTEHRSRTPSRQYDWQDERDERQDGEAPGADCPHSGNSPAPLHIVGPALPPIHELGDSATSRAPGANGVASGKLPNVVASSTVRPASLSFFASGTSAEFVAQSAVLLGCHELIDTAPQLFGDLVEALCGRLAIIALVVDEHEQHAALELLERRGLDTAGVTFFHVDHDTIWARDYGPFLRRTTDGRAAVLDAGYGDGDRPHDDQVPEVIASLFDLHLIRVPFELEGGNLLSNGAGLCISTLRLRDQNDLSLQELREHFRTYYGCDQTVFLEPLREEESGHIDMFATFTSESTVVVGKYDEEVDPDNAALLDRNAARLAQVRCSKDPLNVVRIPMPARAEGKWTTYTNVIYANGALLVPVYGGPQQSSGRAEALSTYARLLPGWDIIAIEASLLSESGGALHCLAMNLPTLGPSADLPRGCSTAVPAPVKDVQPLGLGPRQRRPGNATERSE